MGKLEIPLPELRKGELESAAKDMQARLRSEIPEKLRNSVKVDVFRKGGRTGLVVSYDDKAESLVYTALEYPQGSGKHQKIQP